MEDPLVLSTEQGHREIHVLTQRNKVLILKLYRKQGFFYARNPGGSFNTILKK